MAITVEILSPVGKTGLSWSWCAKVEYVSACGASYRWALGFREKMSKEDAREQAKKIARSYVERLNG